jgi:sugar lactone lactonase YvrE
MLRRLSALAALALALTFGAGAPASADHRTDTDHFPERLELPNGFWPEGIAIGERPTAWVGSLVNGDIYQLNLRTGEGKVLAKGPGTPSVGMKVDDHGRLFVSGGPTGGARVIDTRSGKQLAAYTFTSDKTVFINDVVLTRHMAWFTDSFNARLFGVPLGRHGAPGDAADVVELHLTGDWTQSKGPGEFNANGIATTPDRHALLVVNTTAGKLYRVDPRSGEARTVDLGTESVPGGDGMLRLGRTLYLAQNFPKDFLTTIRLNDDGTRGRLVERRTSANFDAPTTIADFHDWLYVVNARFRTTPGPTVQYWVSRVDR